MQITSDIVLYGNEWRTAVENFSTFFKPTTQYQIFMLALSIGIMYDRMNEKNEDEHGDPIYVARNVIANNDAGKLDFLFQTAVLTSENIDFDEKTRLKYAFDETTDTKDFNKINFLIKFANFGVSKLNEQHEHTPLETMEKLKNFLFNSVEGKNFDFKEIPDDILIDLD